MKKLFFTGLMLALLTLCVNLVTASPVKDLGKNVSAAVTEVDKDLPETIQEIEYINGKPVVVYLETKDLSNKEEIDLLTDKEKVYTLLASNDGDFKPLVYGAPVDTIESVDDILEQGMYYVKNPPGKTASVMDWIGYVLGILALLYAAFIFFTKSKTEKKE